MAASFTPYGSLNTQEIASANFIDSFSFLREPNVDRTLLANLFPQELIGLHKDLSIGDWMRIKNQTHYWSEATATFFNAATYAGTASDARSNTSTGTGIVNGVSFTLVGMQRIRLATTSCLPAVATESLAAGTTTLVREGNIIQFPTKGRLAQYLVCYVQVNAAFEINLYVKKVNASTPDVADLLPSVGGNVTSVVFGCQQNADSEGGDGLVKSISPTLNTYQATLTPITEDMTVTDMTFETKAWYTGQDTPNGTKIYNIYDEAYNQTLTRFLGAARTSLATRVSFDSALTNYAGAPLRASNGFISEFEEKSSGITYGIITTQTLQAIDATRRIKKMSTNLDMLEGAKFTYAFNDWRSETYNAGAIVYDNDVFNLNFDVVKYGEMTLNRRSLNVLNDPDVLGITGSAYPKMCFIIPSDKIAVQVFEGAEKKTIKAKNLTFLYNFIDGAQDTGISNAISSEMPRFFRTSEFGGLARQGATDRSQKRVTHFNATIGSALHAAGQSMILTSAV